jgi:hypothetical protein
MVGVSGKAIEAAVPAGTELRETIRRSESEVRLHSGCGLLVTYGSSTCGTKMVNTQVVAQYPCKRMKIKGVQAYKTARHSFGSAPKQPTKCISVHIDCRRGKTTRAAAIGGSLGGSSLPSVAYRAKSGTEAMAR